MHFGRASCPCPWPCLCPCPCPRRGYGCRGDCLDLGHVPHAILLAFHAPMRHPGHVDDREAWHNRRKQDGCSGTRLVQARVTNCHTDGVMTCK